MNSPLSRFVPPYRSNDNLISETRYSGPSSHPPVRSYLGFDPYSIGGHFRGDDRMCPPREYSDIASPFPRMGEMPPREYSDVAYPFPPTG